MLRRNKYPIPVHCELKGPKGKLSPYQEKEKKRILDSGSIHIVIRSPEELHQFFVDHGLNKMVMPNQALRPKYNEHDLNKFVKHYLQVASRMYGNFYFERNHQNIGSKKGRPDWYFEIPNMRDQFQ